LPGFDNQVLWCGNQNFSDPTGTQFSHAGEFTAAGDLAIGTGGVAPAQQIAVGHLVGSGGISIGYSNPNITISGSGIVDTLVVDADVGTASPSSGTLNVVGSGGITTSASGNTLTITGPSSVSWSNISASQTLVVNSGYFCSSGGALSLALPATSAVGDTIEVLLCGSTSFTVTQAAGQQITLANTSTTAGVGGSLSSTQQGDAIRIICRTANLLWQVGPGSLGNLTMV